MNEFFETSVFCGVCISLLAYGAGAWLKSKWKLAVFNPLLLAVIFTILFLKGLDIEYSVYQESAKYITFLLTPSTICLAVPLYEQMGLLRKHYKAVLFGILSGVLTSLLSVLLLAYLFGLDHASYVTLLPKSITTAIGMDVSKELGGYVSVTVAIIIITGVLGNILAEAVFKILKIDHPIARGIALGTSSHAIGTVKAMEMGQVEGAMSSLSIVVSGILTVAGASLFAHWM